MHFSKANSSASMALILKLKRVGQGQRRLFDPFSNHTSPNIRASRESEFPGSKRPLRFFIDAIKNKSSSIICLIYEKPVEAQERLWESSKPL